MQRLIEGVHKFRREEFGRYRELFARLSREGQNPHTLFITCSDSRVLAELVTQSQPGDLFVVKNAGNIVPPATVTGSTNSTAAAIEYAVHILGVADVVVCGHTQCGAMTALLDGLPDAAAMPHAAAWLEVAAPVREVVRREYQHLDTVARVTAAAEENVLLALENLRSYPGIADRLKAGELRLHGWCFKIDTAEMFAYEPGVGQFQPLVV
ncbi:MAG TPA: carbonic anhydrase [Verrucomicrobiae bacterium]|nr:carbonic anhydrase [Verrucomicrobiae bacterium]